MVKKEKNRLCVCPIICAIYDLWSRYWHAALPCYHLGKVWNRGVHGSGIPMGMGIPWDSHGNGNCNLISMGMGMGMGAMPDGSGNG